MHHTHLTYPEFRQTSCTQSSGAALYTSINWCGEAQSTRVPGPAFLLPWQEDHALAAEDNLVASSATPGGVGVGPGAGPAEGDGRGGGPSPEEVLRRAQAIQGYLCSFEAQVRTLRAGMV